MNDEALRPLEERIAAACAAWERPDLKPVVLEGKRTWPVRAIFGRFMLSRPVGEALDDAQLRALVGYQLTRSPALTAHAWAPYMLTPLSILFMFVAAALDLPTTLLPLPLGLMLVNVVLVLRSGTYGWAETPRLQAFVERGGDLGALAAAQWIGTVVTWAGTGGGLPIAMIGYSGVVKAMTRLAGCSEEELLRRGGMEIDDSEEAAEPPPPKTWLQRNSWWLRLLALVALGVALRLLR